MSEEPKRENRQVHFTDKWCATIKAEDKPVDWRDAPDPDEPTNPKRWVPGLVYRVEPSGKRSWALPYRFNRKARRFKIGTYPEKSPDAARKEARKARSDTQGTAPKDPQGERKRERKAGTVAKAVESWLADEKHGPAGKWKGGLEGGTARSFLGHIRALEREYGDLAPRDLTHETVEPFVTEPKEPATRNRRLAALKMFVKWAKRKRYLTSDPTAELEKEEGEGVRDRVLTDEELRALVDGFDQTRHGPVVRLLALTGCRLMEVLHAEWSWFDADASTLTIPPEAEKATKARKKAKEKRRVALSPQALALLAAHREELLQRPGAFPQYIFATATGKAPGRDCLKPTLYRLRGRRQNGKPSARIKRAMPPTPPGQPEATIHDVRRTVASALQNRVGLHEWTVRYVVLGHVRDKLARTYMPKLEGKPFEEAREGLTRWAEALDGILAATPAAKKETRR